MQNIFISYRRDDAADVTGRISDALKATFGEAGVFKDVDSIRFGSDFRQAIAEAVQKCEVFLAVIGDDWLRLSNQSGQRRIDDSNDYVHIEIAAALERNIPVIPVLVEGAKMPRSEDLPQPLRELAFRNAVDVRRDPDFHNDMDRLCRDIKLVLRGKRRMRQHSKALAMIGALAIPLLLSLAVTKLGHRADIRKPSPTAASTPAFYGQPSPEPIQPTEKPPAGTVLQEIYFLGIGINSYQFDPARHPQYAKIKLRYASEDMMRLRETFKRYNPASRRVVFNLLLNSDATRPRIMDELRLLSRELENGSLGIVAFSGIEAVDKAGTFYILPFGSDPDNPDKTAISAADINEALGEQVGKLILFMDTCRSAQMARAMFVMNPQTVTFASAGANEYCYEDDSFGENGGGAFSSALVSGLEGKADSNKDGLVTVAELAVFAPAETRRLVEPLRLAQHPMILGNPLPSVVTSPGKHPP